MHRRKLSLFVIFVMAVCAFFVVEGAGQQKEPEHKVSHLMELYQPEKMTAKHVETVKKATGGEYAAGSVSRLTVTPPGHLYKLAWMSGKIPEKQVKDILLSMKEEMEQLAKRSKATLPTKTKDTISDRPISHLRALIGPRWVYLDSLRGYYFDYKQANSDGAVVIVAARNDPDDPTSWRIACAVHEPLPRK